jgi:hypothetical protein
LNQLRIELVIHSGCRNADVARDRLREACATEGIEASWREWDRDDESTPRDRAAMPSPTILVDGRDVAGEVGITDGASCRLYPPDDGGAPPVASIVAAIQRAHMSNNEL